MAKKKRVYPKEFLEYVQSITNKRAKIVIDHILAHGFITTEDLKRLMVIIIRQGQPEMCVKQEYRLKHSK